MSSRRTKLIEQLNAGGRDTSAVAVMFHTAVAEKVGLSASEEKAIDLLERFGPMTAGALAEHTKLSPPTVTALVDKLERKHFVRRIAHPADKRSVLIEVRPEALQKLYAYFRDFAASMQELYENYSDRELEVILDFLKRATDRQREATAKLTG